MSSSDLSPDELTLSELRKIHGIFSSRLGSGRHTEQRNATTRRQASYRSSSLEGSTLRILSVFSGQELSPRVEEGAALLAGNMSVKVKTVDVSSWLLDKHRAWTPAAKEVLHSIQQQNYDLVFVTLLAKGMSRALFANKQGPAPLRNKRYP